MPHFVLESARHSLVGSVISTIDDGFGQTFLRGQLLPDPPDPSHLYVEIESPRTALPDYFELGCVPVVSVGWLDLVTSLVDNIQAWPASIQFEDESVDGYCVLNVIGRLAALDARSSEVTTIGSRVFRMKRWP